jgi:ABC-type uncharacterized transport system YnjBCD ATPase subunit
MIENVTLRMEGTKLVAEIDLTVEGRLSKRGKSTLIATTGGEAVRLGALFGDEVAAEDVDVVIGVNVYRPLVAA